MRGVDRSDPSWLLTPLGLVVVAVVVAEAAVGEVGLGLGGRPLALCALTVVFAASISAFLLRPGASERVRLTLFATAAVSVLALHVVDPRGPVIGLFLVAALAPLTEPRRAATAVLLGVVAAFNVVQLAGGGETLPLTVATDAGVAFFYLFGHLLQRERTQRERLALLLDELERTRAAEREATAVAQRAELARDLHDVLAHSMSGLVMQLSAAGLLAEATGADPRLRETIDRATGLARSGLDEARGAVGALRGEQPAGTAQLARLVEHHRAASSAAVTMQVEGVPTPLPPEADLVVYRVVQEALSNVRKHGVDGACEVRVRWLPDHLVVTVTNPAAGDPAGDGGYGLAGMSERAAQVGGRISHRSADGCFELTLDLPLVPRP